MQTVKKANRLAKETSPYLRQHAHNPVDWYAWGPEALAEAKRRDCPIFLSIGYSACHWCHVMERESFEDAAIAAQLNAYFVNVKVDREERPDLDQIYMSAVQLMTHHGGWPMSVWLTPDGRPFYGGTYFPPTPRFGMRSFREVIGAVSDAWKNRRKDVENAADSLTEDVGRSLSVPAETGTLQAAWIVDAARKLERAFDRTFGGIGRAPKFPHSVEYRLLFRAAQRTGDSTLRDLATLSLERMSAGGIYDQLGGGFHRYSTDERWLVPHFEKMLYDNALIPRALLEAYQATGNPNFLQTTRETLEYVLREMTDPAGGFYSTQDADSEGKEGKFFVWTKAEIEATLDPRTAEIFCNFYDVTAEGNWEGVNILHRPKSLDQASKVLSVSVDELASRLADARCKLFAVRQQRVHPGTDQKILVAWNGLMIDTMATAAQVLDQPRFRDAAVRAADFVLREMLTPAGLLRRAYKDGTARLNGYLEDYAAFANALVSVYEATFDPKWLREALAIVEVMLAQFWDDRDGGFFFTGKDHERLIARHKDAADNATPSGNALAAHALARLWRLTGKEPLRQKTEQTLVACRGLLVQAPAAAPQMLLALGMHAGPTFEFVFVADPAAPETRKMLRALHTRFVPNKVIALRRPGDGDSTVQEIGLFAGRPQTAERPTVYICKDFVCRSPVAGFEALAAEIDRLDAGSRR